jgi:uncharacterized protein DUF6600/FecR-like protein
MLRKINKRLSSVPPLAIIAVALIAIVAAVVAAVLLTRGSSKVDAATLQPTAARIDRVDGSVGIAPVEDNKEPDWSEATVNTPVTVGDRIYARDNSRASIALSGHNSVRLDPGCSVDVLALTDQRTQLALRGGSAMFDVGALSSDDFYEVATPCGAVDFQEPGLYQIGIDGTNTTVSVLSGLAQIIGQSGSSQLAKGQVVTLTEAATEALASRLSPQLAGRTVDDYYRYRYPKRYDGRYVSYDSYLADPFYFDPYRSSVSCRYLPADIPGVYDLDDYGDWSDIEGYGNCWAPRVNAGWAPFRDGYWDVDDPWGPSWVAREPWGWTPFHYGRWAFLQQRWVWVPAEVRPRTAYCPATVAFVPITATNQIAWVPLAPGEVYVPRYYDARFEPRFLASRELIRQANEQRTFANLYAPSAVTIVPVRSFTRVVDPTVIAQVDPRVIAGYRGTLDPLSISGVRELAVNHEDARRRIRLARAEEENLNRSVVTTTQPPSLPNRIETARAFKLEEVPADRRKNKLKIDQSNEVATTQRPDGLPQLTPGQQQQVLGANAQEREQRMAQLSAQAAQGDRAARRELRQLKRETPQAPASQQQPGNQQPPAAQPTQREQLHDQMKQQRSLERQQQPAVAAQQQEQRKAARQAQQAQQAQQDQMRKLQRQQRQVERQQQQNSIQQQQQQQQRADQMRREQQKQVREQQRVQRAQQPPQPQPQQQQTRKEQRQQKRKPPENPQQNPPQNPTAGSAAPRQ